jgi:hypothetical protein
MSNTSDVMRQAIRHQDRLLGYAFALTRDWSSAEDAVQETLVAIHEHGSRFREGAAYVKRRKNCWCASIRTAPVAPSCPRSLRAARTPSA